MRCCTVRSTLLFSSVCEIIRKRSQIALSKYFIYYLTKYVCNVSMDGDLQHRFTPTPTLPSRDENPSPQLLLLPHLQTVTPVTPLDSALAQNAECPSLSFRRSGLQTFQCAHVSTRTSPLAATLIDLPASVANKRLTVSLNPLDATFTKNRGRPALSPYASFTSLRLFLMLFRIAVRMTATISCLTSQRSSFFGTPATPGPTLFFSGSWR